MRNLTDGQLTELVELLEGSCDSLDEATYYLFGKDSDFLSQDDLADIDDNVFKCECCGWWYNISEMSGNGEQLCQDCNE